MEAPSFKEIVNEYGPYLGLLISILISFMVMQYRWFRKVIRVKDQEIDRLVKREDELNKRLMHIIDAQVNYKEKRTVKRGVVTNNSEKRLSTDEVEISGVTKK